MNGNAPRSTGSSASIYLRDGLYILQTSAPTTLGWCWATELVSVLKGGATDADLGNVALETLKAGRFVQPHPTREEMAQQRARKALMKAAGVRSVTALARGARSVDLADLDDGSILLSAWANQGPRNAMEPVKDWGPVDVTGMEGAELGAAIREALRHAPDDSRV